MRYATIQSFQGMRKHPPGKSIPGYLMKPREFVVSSQQELFCITQWKHFLTVNFLSSDLLNQSLAIFSLFCKVIKTYHGFSLLLLGQIGTQKLYLLHFLFTTQLWWLPLLKTPEMVNFFEVYQPYWGRLFESPSTGGAGCGSDRCWPQVSRVGTGWEVE